MKKTEKRVLMPLFFPSFWATVEAVRATDSPDPAESTVGGGGGGTITLKVVKHFGPVVVVLRHIAAQPIGVATTNSTTFTLRKPFDCTVTATTITSSRFSAPFQDCMTLPPLDSRNVLPTHTLD